jgi:GT2 family glycosyltransferase
MVERSDGRLLHGLYTDSGPKLSRPQPEGVRAGGQNSTLVIVINWNRWEDTLRCVESLHTTHIHNLDILVVDNASTDDSRENLRRSKFEFHLVELPSNIGFGGGCNVGIEIALEKGFEFVWLVNNDAIVSPDSLNNLVAAANANPHAGAIGSVIKDMDPPHGIQVFGGGQIGRLTGVSRPLKRAGAVDYVSGASMLIRTAAILEVGAFDEESFFMYWEDADLCRRLTDAGWTLEVCESSVVWHALSASLGRSNPRLDYFFIRSAVRFFFKHWQYPVVSIVILTLGLLGKRLMRIQPSNMLAVLRGVVDGVR